MADEVTPLLPERFAQALIASGRALDLVRRPTKHAEDIPVPAVEQQTGWTCGPACVRAAHRLFYPGQDKPEEFYAKLLGASPEDGTPPQAMVRGLWQLGIEAVPVSGMTLPQLERQVILGHPVIVCFQAWSEDPKWYDLDESGHWAVVRGRDARTLHFEDPSADGGLMKRPKDVFFGRWHDVGGGRRWLRFGIILKGRREAQAARGSPGFVRPAAGGPCLSPSSARAAPRRASTICR